MLPIFTKVKQYHLAVFAPLQSYLDLTTGDEAAFWRSPSPSNLSNSVKAWATGPGWWYLAKVLLVRIALRYSIYLFTAAFALVTTGLILAALLARS